MDKYVHIEDLKDYLNRQIRAFEPCPDKYDAAVGIYNGLYQIPAADVALVRHGKWIFYHYELYGCYYECSNCKYESNKKTNFCPSCGAKMDDDKND